MGRYFSILVCCFVPSTFSAEIPNPGGPVTKNPPASGNFSEFLSAELVRFGGRENKLDAVPELHWCHVTGQAYPNDFGLAEGSKLIIPEKVKKLIEIGKHEDVSFVGGDHPPSQEEIRAKVWADAAKLAQELKTKGEGASHWLVCAATVLKERNENQYWCACLK